MGRCPRGLFPVILDLAIEAVNAQRGVLLILEGDALRPKAHKGRASAYRPRSGTASSTKRHRCLCDAQLDAAFKDLMSIVEQKVHTMMAVPLQAKERIIGLIYVDSPFVLREFTKDDLSLLTVMGNVAAIRIENARLAEVEQVERINDTLKNRSAHSRWQARSCSNSEDCHGSRGRLSSSFMSTRRPRTPGSV
jgi:sigma-B regulation protein RsbU (phosphoserine phosphatase)